MSALWIDKSLHQWQRSTGAVGVVAAVVDRQGVRWECGLGVADLETRRPMDPASTVLNVASVSKLVTATAVMTLVEAGSIGLDDPVDRPLGSPLRHPRHPEHPITIRQLLTHTAAIADGPAYDQGYTCDDPDGDLGAWLTRYLDPDGDLFEPANWHDWAPGQGWSYSNVAFGVCGLLVERVTGTDFRDYTRRAIFEPLGMGSSGWFVADVDRDRLAVPHVAPAADAGANHRLADPDRSSDGGWVPLCAYGFPTYPDGLLRTTARDLARFVQAALAGDPAILGQQTLAMVFSDSVPSAAIDARPGRPRHGQGLGWRHLASPGHPDRWGHDGSDPGVRARVAIDRTAGIGVVALTNCAAELPAADRLLDAAVLS